MAMARSLQQQGRQATDGTSGVSKETAAFLNDLLKEKKLSLRAQQEVQNSIRAGSSRWVNCINTGTAAAHHQPASKALFKGPKPSSRSSAFQVPPPFRPCIKTQQQIEAEQAKQPEEHYHSRPGIDRQAEKDRLTNVFAYGRKGVQEMQIRAAQKAAADSASSQQRSHTAPIQEQMIDQIVNEINERSEYVEQLKRQGMLIKEQEAAIKAEVSQRMAELRRLGVDAN